MKKKNINTNIRNISKNFTPAKNIEDNIKLEIRARIKESKRNFVFIEATISHNGTICSIGELTFYCFSKEIAEKDFFFTGCELEE